MTTDSPDAVLGTMTPYIRTEEGNWEEAWASFPVVVGRNGMAWDEGALSSAGNPSFTILKREGDGRSPIGCFPLLQAFGRERNPAIKMDYQSVYGLEGIDDPASRYYNRLVRREEVAAIDWISSERMEDFHEEYEWGLVVGYNPDGSKSGSCIFIHVWTSPQKGTAGCTAMEKKNMKRLIEWLDPARRPHLLQSYAGCPFLTL